MDRKQLEQIAKASAKERLESKIKEASSYEEKLAVVKNIDALRSKKRKTPTKAEKIQAESEEILNAVQGKLESSEPIITETLESPLWDVPIDQEIRYFDPSLSYELTGYRPITSTTGLDFNPKLFTVAADAYRTNGRYTLLAPGTFLHREHWQEEFNKCHDGVTIGNYRLTGLHYFFLNYYRLLSVLSDKPGQEVRQEDFPAFIAKLYEYFHYLEMVQKLGKDGLAFKSRGVNIPALF